MLINMSFSSLPIDDHCCKCTFDIALDYRQSRKKTTKEKNLKRLVEKIWINDVVKMIMVLNVRTLHIHSECGE